jgi:hypothetical protein
MARSPRGLCGDGAPPLRRTLQVARAFDNFAELHPDELVGRALEQRGLVRDDENRLALIAETGQQPHHVGSGMEIHIREGFVEQKDFGVVQQRPGQRHALPHALRILADGADEFGIEPDGADRLGAARAAADAVKPRKVFQVLHPAHLVVEQRRVCHVAHLVANVVKLLRPENRDLAA